MPILKFRLGVRSYCHVLIWHSIILGTVRVVQVAKQQRDNLHSFPLEVGWDPVVGFVKFVNVILIVVMSQNG